MPEKTLEEKGQENMSLLDEKEKIIEAEIETHRTGLHDAKMRLKKVKALKVQLTKLLTA